MSLLVERRLRRRRRGPSARLYRSFRLLRRRLVLAKLGAEQQLQHARAQEIRRSAYAAEEITIPLAREHVRSIGGAPTSALIEEQREARTRAVLVDLPVGRLQLAFVAIDPAAVTKH